MLLNKVPLQVSNNSSAIKSNLTLALEKTLEFGKLKLKTITDSLSTNHEMSNTTATMSSSPNQSNETRRIAKSLPLADEENFMILPRTPSPAKVPNSAPHITLPALFLTEDSLEVEINRQIGRAFSQKKWTTTVSIHDILAGKCIWNLNS